MDNKDYIEVKKNRGDVRLGIFTECDFIRLSPEEARRMAKKLKKYANEISPKEATIS